MTTPLPPLKWVPSPNFSERTAPVDLIVVHDCQGSYQGSIATFKDPHNYNAHGIPNPVSAHIVLKDDGSEATQMVDFTKKAWHCMSFNSRSVGIEMAGFAERGFPETEWDATAHIVAFLLHAYKLPCQWAHHGAGPGYTSHFDLGKAGGGHSDPTTEPNVWAGFVKRVEAAYAAGGFPATWGRGLPDHPAPPPAPPISVPPIRGIAWAQDALNRWGWKPGLKVDGIRGHETAFAIKAFQKSKSLPATGLLDPETITALAATK